MNRYGRAIGRALYAVGKHLPEGKKCFGIGFHVRRLCGRMILDSFDQSSSIEKGADFCSSIIVGKHSALGINCVISNTTIIGDYVMMAPEVMIAPGNHVYERTDIPMCQQGEKQKKVTHIMNDVWLCSRCIVLQGVTVGDGAIVCAGAVVTKDVPPYAIVGGVPAKVIKYRK